MTLHAYQSVKRATLIEGASPHRLVELLYEGALNNIAIARKHVASRNRQDLHACVDKAIAIIQELQGSLKDFETNEVSANLYDLYNYLVKTLIESQQSLSDEGFASCANLIEILLDAWRTITPEQAAA